MEHLLAMRLINRSDGARRRRQALNLHRSIRDLSNPFSDPHFRAHYRLLPDMALSLIEEIRDYYPKSSYGNAIPVEIKFLAALHFYAQGSYQKPDGKDATVSLSQSSVSRAIAQTTNALNAPPVLCKWIRFPCGVNERQQKIDENFRKFNLPGVLGYVDGTHIIIKKPVVHEELYVNRKGQHSLNVQVVCDSDLLILNLIARYPGSSHDAFIWKASTVRDHMVASINMWLLGDSGYPLEPWLLTPVLNAPEGTAEGSYTHMHILARNSIERCFGVWKNRFRCLHKHRTLEYAPEKAGQITNACAVLHNICIKGDPQVQYLDEEPDDNRDSGDQNVEDVVVQDNDILQRAVIIRAGLINRLNFS